jgi:hypothetical protein
VAVVVELVSAAWILEDLRGVVWADAVDGFFGEVVDFLCAAE